MSDYYSIHSGTLRKIGVLDYILFSLIFLASAAVGFYHAYKDRNSFDSNNFHLGGKKMHPVPVSLSLVVTFLSALTIIGTPAEVYTFGTMVIWLTFGMFLATAGTAHVFLPVFYNLNKTSTFAYLQIRFGTVTRIFASGLYLLQTLIYMGFVLYVPSLALEAVTGLSLWGSMCGVASVCSLYTMLGGMKTVVWTDTLQFAFMLFGILSLLIKGSLEIGGFSNAWTVAYNNSRIEFTNFSFDLRTRHSVWSLGIGGGLFWLYLYGVNQSQVQRQCSLPTLHSAQLAVWLNLPGLVLIQLLACLTGIVMYAFYSECDPVEAGLVKKNDQIIPLMVLDVLGSIPGLAGIFSAAVFSGSLSSLSSGLNAMAAIIIEDFVKYFFCKSLTEKKEILLSKVAIVVTGLTTFCVALLIIETDQVVIMQLSYSLYSMVSGPLFGCFIVGMLFPWTNKHGALFGLITSLGLTGWLLIGTQIYRPVGTRPLPVVTDGCSFIDNSWSTFTPNTSLSTVSTIRTTVRSTISSTTETIDYEDEPLVYDFYRISYQWYTGFGAVINIVVSLTVSFFTGFTDPKSLDRKLICPLFYKITTFLPKRVQNCMHIGASNDNATIDQGTEEELELVGSENVRKK